MGLENENYFKVFKTGLISNPKNSNQFQKTLLSSQQASIDLFVSPIFTSQSLVSHQINLDDCFVPTHQSFTYKQLSILCPLINSNLLHSEIENRLQKLSLFADYCVYLGLKRVAVKFEQQNWEKIVSSLQKIAKNLKKSKIGLVVIVKVKESSAQELDRLWHSYIKFRNAINEKMPLQLCLQFASNIPQVKRLQNWLGQSVATISFSSTSFVLNHKGYPVLPANAEQILKTFIKCHVNLMVTENSISQTQLKVSYFKFYGYVLNKMVQNMTQRQIQAQNLLDYLQSPLQPYRDNLQAEIYDIFEKDDHKYNQYQKSFLEFLVDFKQERACVTYYVGSGKGLILNKFMKAVRVLKKKVKVYCVQKNPFPIQSLKRRIQKNKWSKFVEVVQADIKDYVMPEAPDLIFSELLGGIGDNELSPQCLRWAEKNVTASTKFIPERYTAFIRPISTHILWKLLAKQERQSYFTVNFGLFFSPFESKKIWEFNHPLPKQDNLERNTSISWQVNNHMLIQGFQGSFDCNLYGKAYFSIRPENKQKNFYSWFPLYFPFKQQQQVDIGFKFIIQVSRKSNEKRVWYQWRYSIFDKEGMLKKLSDWHNENAGLALELINDEE